MQAEFEGLAEHLWKLGRRSRLFFLANQGNWGDSLIRAGSLKFFKDYGFDVVELDLHHRRSWPKWAFLQDTLIYGGGGGWCSLWDHSATILQDRRRSFRRIVVLPSSYEHAYAIEHTTFYCRDRYESLCAMPDATFCHDMAFYLGPQASSAGEGVGYFFRTDRESLGRFQLPDGNCDLSLEGDHRTDPSGFFDRIARFQVIHTDRLHVGIASCLLGRELHLYPGKYFKNKAVYLSSMLGHFDHVSFHECALPVVAQGGMAL